MRVGLKFWAMTGVILLLTVFSMGFVRRSISVTFSDGSTVRIEPPCLWGAVRESQWLITYQPVVGAPGTVALSETWLESPVIVMQSSDGHSLLCLYYNEVDLKLLRIDPASSPRPYPPKSALPFIVLASPWLVREGTDPDWSEFAAWYGHLAPTARERQSVPDLDLGFMRLYSDFSRNVPDQIRINHLNRGNDGHE
jgi:hypothetical protein